MNVNRGSRGREDPGCAGVPAVAGTAEKRGARIAGESCGRTDGGDARGVDGSELRRLLGPATARVAEDPCRPGAAGVPPGAYERCVAVGGERDARPERT